MSFKSLQNKVDNPISALWSRFRWVIVGVCALSLVTNLLMLTGPLFMLQIYDRVLASRSVPTLVALIGLVAFLYAFYGIIDYIRSRIMARVGEVIDDDHRADVFDYNLKMQVLNKLPRDAEPTANLSRIRQFLGTPAPLALFDIPWSPFYLAILFMFHPWLGYIALGGGVIAIALTFINERVTRKNVTISSEITARAKGFERAISRNAEVITSLGMLNNVKQKWLGLKVLSDNASRKIADQVNGFNTSTKTIRYFLQSLILGVGAYLVIQGQITPGTIIAGSILMGRALAPFDVAIGQWKQYSAFWMAYKKLNSLYTQYARTTSQKERIALPKLEGQVKLSAVFLAPPTGSRTVLKGVSFTLKPGDGLGIIGPSASGKSTLIRALVGIWPISQGSLQLDGVEIHLWDKEALGAQIGYLPQEVGLIRGSIKDNICRFDPKASDESIIQAATRAEVHNMITAFPDGYETEIGDGAAYLSGGQRQRIGLARALYNNPSFIVLDEPNSNLDSQGDKALNLVIKRLRTEGKTVVVVAHRPSAMESLSYLLCLNAGRVAEFAPRDEVLNKLMPSGSSATVKHG